MTEAHERRRAELRAAREHARIMADFERRLKALETTSSLARSSVDDGALSATVGDTTTMLVGAQFDGTNVAATLTGPAPPRPSAPLLTPTSGGLLVRWDGQFATSLGVVDPFIIAPMDFKQVDVAVSTDAGADFIAIPPSHSFLSPRGGEVFLPLPGVPQSVALIARSLTGRPSLVSVVTTAVPVGIGATDGLPPSTAPTISVGSGIGSIRVSVEPVPNADPVQYEYHVSPVDFVAVPGDPSTLVHTGPEASNTIIRDASGVPLAFQPYWVSVIAFDADGYGPVPTSLTITPGQSPDIAGTVKEYSGTTLPDGWEFADGAPLSAALYPDLAAAYDLGGGLYKFGSPGPGQFNKPNLPGYAPDIVLTSGVVTPEPGWDVYSEWFERSSRFVLFRVILRRVGADIPRTTMSYGNVNLCTIAAGFRPTVAASITHSGGDGMRTYVLGPTGILTTTSGFRQVSAGSVASYDMLTGDDLAFGGTYMCDVVGAPTIQYIVKL